MKNKCLAVYILVLTFSCSLFAMADTEPAKGNIDVQIPLQQIRSQENMLDSVLVTRGHGSMASEPIAGNKDDWVTEMSVYLIIIAVYSLYWFLFCSKKVKD
ncbi:hypothetical protein [Methylovulum miyakonense]|uniref:hypothetical protein n=1 Tax=Methylovulum miyakonense TaxID=645578 RepID=UPI000379C61B|nr:hypothetical protein [Methylovulum miyakonense]